MSYSLPKCDEVGCTGHLGKFASCLTEALWQISLDSFGDYAGDSDWHGYFSLVIVDCADFEAVPLEFGPIVAVPRGAYMVETTPTGATYHYAYASEADAREEFGRIESAWCAWLEESEESYAA